MPDDYRTKQGSTVDLEIFALGELAYRVKRLRSRVLLPAGAAALLVGHLGVAAHALGRWSIFGTTSDGSYILSVPTILIAFCLPALPCVIVGAILYRALGARVQRAWCDEFSTKHGLPREMLERNAMRYG